MFKKRFSFVSLIVICILVSAVTMVGSFFAFPKSSLARKVDEITAIINNNFDGEINEELMDEAVFTSLVKSLNDKYGAYYSVDNSKEFLGNFEKENQGLGINYRLMDNGNMQVVILHENSPADKAGIKLHDEIIGVDELTIKKDGHQKLLERIEKKLDGGKVSVKLLRNGKELTVNVTLGIFEKQTVFYENVDGIGYIKFTHFDDSTTDGFKLALNNLKAANVKALLFDVRNNSGGTVTAVCDVLDLLLPECDLISAKYKNGEMKVLRTSDANCEDLPMAVLTNGASASASELFAAAIREVAGGKIIGEKTFGKGQIQTIFNLSDGSVLKITVGKFYSPKGNNWDEKGIEPDITVKLTEEQNQNFYFLTTETDPVIIKGIESLK